MLLSGDDILSGLQGQLRSLEPEAMALDAATAGVRYFSQVERLAAAGKALCARRCAETGAHRAGGHRNAAEWLSSVTNEPLGQSIGALETGAAAAESPALDDAMRQGDLSPAQSREIASAAAVDPSSAEDLVEKAKTASLGDLKRAADEARRRAASELSDIERIESIRRRRRLRTWVDPDGAGRIDGLFAPDDFARLRGTLDPIADRLFGDARRAGRSENRDALLADALIEALSDPTGAPASAPPAGPSSSPSPTGDPASPPPAGSTSISAPARVASTSSPGAMVRFVVDIEAFFRGEARGGERCEIPGVGSVPVAMARAVLGDAILELVIKHGVDVVSVTHLGRAVPSAIRRALEERDQRCVVPGCEVTKGLEIDHWKIDFAAGGPTELWNLCRLCKAHHGMKSYRGYRLDGGPGAWKWLPPGNQSGPSPPGDRPPPDRPPPPARPVKPGPFADGDEPVASSSTTGAARTSDPVDGAISAERTDERPEPPQAPEPPQPPEPPPTLFDIAS